MHFRNISESLAKELCRSLHYLGTYREGSMDFGLFMPGDDLPTAYCSVSGIGFDSRRSGLARMLQVEERQIAVVSRSYTSPLAPRNTVSYLLARVRKALRGRPGGYEVMATAVDSNLGFTGASYAAAGWKLVTKRAVPKYRYIDGNFMADRQVFSSFGTLRSDLLRSALGAAYAESSCGLKPRLIFGVMI
ncbi:Mom family adenine methylcarbamoylation protein [Streptomyces nigra]